MWRLNLLRSRLRTLLRPARADAEMSREMAAHLAMLEDEFRRRGLSEQEARIAARRKFGPLERARNLHREARSFVWLEQLGQDLRYTLRTLATSKAYAAFAIVTLAVAIGANTAIFSVVESVLLQPLPYPDEGRIVRVAPTMYEWRVSGGDRGSSFSDRGYWHFVNNNRSFEKLGAYIERPAPYPLTGEGSPREVDVGVVTLNAFEVLGVLPERGQPAATRFRNGSPRTSSTMGEELSLASIEDPELIANILSHLQRRTDEADDEHQHSPVAARAPPQLSLL